MVRSVVIQSKQCIIVFVGFINGLYIAVILIGFGYVAHTCTSIQMCESVIELK